MLTIIVFIAVISILVFVHEMGHFTVARWVGVRVREFSIGMPPKALGFKRGDTEYKIGWLPLGGYVRLEGQNIDDENPSDPNNFAAKSKFQRFLILVAGSFMNLLFALLLMWGFFFLGSNIPAYQISTPLVSAVTKGSIVAKSGIKQGDTIIGIQGNPVADWSELFKAIELNVPKNETILIGYRRLNSLNENTVSIKSKDILKEQADFLGLIPHQPAIVGGFSTGSAAKKAGLKVGDTVTSINGKVIESWYELSQIVRASDGRLLNLEIIRDGRQITTKVIPRIVDNRPLIGVTPPTVKKKQPFFSSFYSAVKRLGDITVSTVVFLGKLVTGRASFDVLGGPVMIGAALGSAAQKGFSDLLFLTSFISLQLGIFNLLPIPVLDGGHIFILGLEGVSRKSISPKLRERIQILGMVFLIGLILLVTFNDVWRLITDRSFGF